MFKVASIQLGIGEEDKSQRIQRVEWVLDQVNPSTPQPEGWGLLRVDPERRFSTPPSKTGLGAVERVKETALVILPEIWNIGYFSFDLYSKESETLSGETVERMSWKAKEHGFYLHAGSMVE